VVPGATELAPGLHRWVTYYPGWGHDVASVAIEHEGGVVLVDPLAPSELREARAFWRALDARARKAAVDVVVTLHYHRRSAPDVAKRFDAPLWAPEGSVARLRVPVDRPFGPGDTLPAGLVAFATGRDDEVVLWHADSRALVSGDVLLGGVRKPYRVCPPSWLPDGVTRTDIARALAPLLDLPVELLVPLHGPPVTADAGAVLAAALAEARNPVK
jgi:glyoxylase-like metal-dependent hydrolase (beta-lactamase superfamily II)